MKEEILKYLESIKQQVKTSRNLQNTAQCKLDEGFYIGIRAGFNNAIYNLEKILNKRRYK